MPRYRDLTRNETNIKHTPWEADSLMSGQSEYLDPNPSKAGAGRGKQGGPTAAQARQNRGMMSDAEKAAREELDFKKMSEYREDQKYAKGGSASARADGIAQRGKTRGTIVACGGGYMKGKK